MTDNWYVLMVLKAERDKMVTEIETTQIAIEMNQAKLLDDRKRVDLLKGYLAQIEEKIKELND